MIIKEYEENGYLIKEYGNGSVVKSLIRDTQELLEPTTPQPTLEEQVSQLQQQNLVLMDALATIYEELLLKEVL